MTEGRAGGAGRDGGTGGAPLAALSVRDFLGQVASAAAAVPAGGSVAALSGAASAALVALVCAVLARHEVADAGRLQARADDLQARLLHLMDEDAAAVRAYLDARKDPVAVARVGDAPLEIARACQAVVDLANEVDAFASGAVRGDVRAARHLAGAAALAALDLADENLALTADPAARRALQDRIDALRNRH